MNSHIDTTLPFDEKMEYQENGFIIAKDVIVKDDDIANFHDYNLDDI